MYFQKPISFFVLIKIPIIRLYTRVWIWLSIISKWLILSNNAIPNQTGCLMMAIVSNYIYLAIHINVIRGAMCNVYINWIPIFVLVTYNGLFINCYNDWAWNMEWKIPYNHQCKNKRPYWLKTKTQNLGIHIISINNLYKMISIRMQVFSRISNKGVRKMLYFKFFFKIKLSKFLLVHFMERWTIFVHIRTHFTYKIGTVTPFLHVDIGMALLRIIWRFQF